MMNKLVSPSTSPKRQSTIVTYHKHPENINKSNQSPSENIDVQQFYLSQAFINSEHNHNINTFPTYVSSNKKEFIRNFELTDFNKLKKKSVVLPSKTVDNFDQNRHISLAFAQISSPSEKKEGSTKMRHFFLTRSTLKDMPLTKSPDKDSKTTMESNNLMQDPEMIPSLLSFLQKQNQKLLRENVLLKKQLSDIKLSLSLEVINKKEQMIINLTKSLNRQNGLIVELKMKEELLNKKVLALEGLINSKDEEILFLNNKLGKSEQQLKQYKNKSKINMNVLEEKISFVLELYQDLQIKFSNQEINNQLWQQQWQHQKNSYLERISLLEGSIRPNS